MEMDINDTIKENTGLIYKQLYKFGLAQDPEAISLSYLALYKAIQTYDPTHGVCTSTYYTVCIYNALGSYVRTLNKQRQIQTVSYNATFSVKDIQNTFMDIMDCGVDIETDYIHKEECKETIAEYHIQMDKLTNVTQKAIIEAWAASNFDSSTTDLADKIGVSQSYVSQVLNNFRYKIRKGLEKKHERNSRAYRAYK